MRDEVIGPPRHPIGECSSFLVVSLFPALRPTNGWIPCLPTPEPASVFVSGVVLSLSLILFTHSTQIRPSSCEPLAPCSQQCPPSLPRVHAHFPVTGDYDVQGQQIITMQRGVIRDSTGDGIANTAVAPQPHRIAGMFHDAHSGFCRPSRRTPGALRRLGARDLQRCKKRVSGAAGLVLTCYAA